MYACSIKNELDKFAFLCILIIFLFCVLKILICMHGCMIVSMTSSSRAPKHVWVYGRVGVCWWMNVRQWHIRLGYLAQLLRMMVAKLPGCNVHATTVIDCHIKTLKRTYQVITEMCGPSCNGFGWNDDAKCIVAEKELFDNWVKVCEKYNCTLI